MIKSISNTSFQFLLLIFSISLLTACGGGSGGGSDSNTSNTSNSNVTNNQAPVANAGNDSSIYTGVAITLDGSGSNDPDGDQLTYLWGFVSKPAGSTSSIFDSSTSTPSFTPDIDGMYIIKVTVHDGVNEVVTDFVTITATTIGVNSAPIANAGDDLTVYTGIEVTLDASNSNDPDGDALIYEWQFVSGPSGSSALLYNYQTANPTITPDIEGNYTFNLVVSDGVTSSIADAVIVTAITLSIPVPPVTIADVYVYSTDIFSNIVYLGCWTCNQYDSESIHNLYSTYGSSYGTYSIRNNYSDYGSSYGLRSACNSYSLDPPSLYDGNIYYYGRLSINSYQTDSICNQFSSFYSSLDCGVLQTYCSQ